MWKKGVDCSMSELITVKKTEKGVEVEVAGVWPMASLKALFRAIERANLQALRKLKEETAKVDKIVKTVKKKEE